MLNPNILCCFIPPSLCKNKNKKVKHFQDFKKFLGSIKNKLSSPAKIFTLPLLNNAFSSIEMYKMQLCALCCFKSLYKSKSKSLCHILMQFCGLCYSADLELTKHKSGYNIRPCLSLITFKSYFLFLNCAVTFTVNWCY